MADQVKDSCPKVSALTLANNHLAINLHKQLAKEGGNVFFSPFSISTALAMLFCGSQGDTAKEMRQILGYEVANLKDEELKDSFQDFLEAMSNNQESYTLSCANSLISHKDFAVREDYKFLLENTFKAMLQEVDFANETAKAVKLINDWVSDKTKKMIPRLLDDLNPATVLVLVNAIYFKGSWMSKFDKKATKPQKFLNNGVNAKDVDMMHLTKRFPFVEMETYKAIQLPYIGDKIDMVVLLPKSPSGLQELEDSLTMDFIQDLKECMYPVKVEVALPKFRLEYTKMLKEQFMDLGMNRVFGDPEADFGGISDSEGLVLSEIIHKAVLVVNEEGSEAAAATAILMEGCAMPMRDPPRFIADHPFLFVICDTESGSVLFMGRVDEL